jgi:hypothetical protein
MVDPPLAPARLSNHRAMRMEGPRFHTGRPVPYRQRARPHSRGDDHNHLTTGRHPSLRFTAGPSRARRLRERVQADLSGPLFVRFQSNGNSVTQRLHNHRQADLLGGGFDGSRVHD